MNSVNTGAKPIHGTSLTKAEVIDLQKRVEEINLDKDSLEEQYNKIRSLIKSLESAGLTNEADSMNLLALRRGIDQAPNARGKRASMPSHYVNYIEQILENILPFAKNSGGRRRRTYRKKNNLRKRSGRHTRK